MILGIRLGAPHDNGNPTNATTNFFGPDGTMMTGFLSNRNDRHYYHSFAVRPLQVLINNKWYTVRTQ